MLAVGLGLVAATGLRVRLQEPVPPVRVAVGEDILKFPTFEHAALEGWGKREDWGVWSVAPSSSLQITIPSGTSSYGLHIKGSFFLNDRHPALVAQFRINGILVRTLNPTVDDNGLDAILPIPRLGPADSDHALTIELSIDAPASPSALGLSTDTRQLGFALKSLQLVTG